MIAAELPILSASRLKDARACQRLHHFKYGLGFRPAEDAEALRFGTLIHAALEAWWSTTLDIDARLDAALAAITAADADPFDKARAEAMTRGYSARWGDDLPLYEVLGVEVLFETALVNPDTGAPSRTWQLGGKVDVILRELATQKVLICEHKTASEDCGPGSEYLKRLRLDGQVSMYYAGVESLGPKPDGVLYDVLRKPGLRPAQIPLVDEGGVKIVLGPDGARVRTKDGKKFRETGDAAQGFVLQTRPETPEEYRDRCLTAIADAPNDFYVRAEVVRLEAEMAEAMGDIWQTARMLRENELRGFFPRNVDSCVRYSRTCEFFGVCCGEASLEDTRLFRRSEHIHPELNDQGATRAA